MGGRQSTASHENTKTNTNTTKGKFSINNLGFLEPRRLDEVLETFNLSKLGSRKEKIDRIYAFLGITT